MNFTLFTNCNQREQIFATRTQQLTMIQSIASRVHIIFHFQRFMFALSFSRDREIVAVSMELHFCITRQIESNVS